MVVLDGRGGGGCWRDCFFILCRIAIHRAPRERLSVKRWQRMALLVAAVGASAAAVVRAAIAGAARCPGEHRLRGSDRPAGRAAYRCRQPRASPRGTRASSPSTSASYQIGMYLPSDMTGRWLRGPTIDDGRCIIGAGTAVANGVQSGETTPAIPIIIDPMMDCGTPATAERSGAGGTGTPGTAGAGGTTGVGGMTGSAAARRWASAARVAPARPPAAAARAAAVAAVESRRAPPGAAAPPGRPARRARRERRARRTRRDHRDGWRSGVAGTTGAAGRGGTTGTGGVRAWRGRRAGGIGGVTGMAGRGGSTGAGGLGGSPASAADRRWRQRRRRRTQALAAPAPAWVAAASPVPRARAASVSPGPAAAVRDRGCLPPWMCDANGFCVCSETPAQACARAGIQCGYVSTTATTSSSAVVRSWARSATRRRTSAWPAVSPAPAASSRPTSSAPSATEPLSRLSRSRLRAPGFFPG